MTARLEGKERLLAKLGERSDKFVRALTLDGLGRLIKRTPVDTGRAKNNWNVGIDAMDTTMLPEGDYSKSGSEALARGAPVVAQIKAGGVIYVTNALPYIGELEKGHSKQAPAGMVDPTVAELKPLARQIVSRVRVGG